MTGPTPDPKRNIGPAYVGIALLCTLMVGGMLVVKAITKQPFGVTDGVIVVAVVLLILALIRPEKFDAAVKTAADRIPFVKYEKPPES